VHGNVLGIGDAVGLTSPLTGGGIFYAIMSGKLSASVILDHFEKNTSLMNFEKIWYDTHGKSISFQWRMNTLLRRLWTDKGWDSCLEQISKNKVFSKNLAESWATYKFENKFVWARIFNLIFLTLLKNKLLG
jgi:flavin-dependent dehydrogenase